MIVKLLTEHNLEFLSLRGGCTGSSKSTLVKMSNCWKSHAAAHIMLLIKQFCIGSVTADQGPVTKQIQNQLINDIFINELSTDTNISADCIFRILVYICQ